MCDAGPSAKSCLNNPPAASQKSQNPLTVQKMNENVGARTSEDENRPEWESTASSSGRLVLRAVRDATDASGLFKSVAGGLCSILETYEVRHIPSQAISKLRCSQRIKANKQEIESLVPRVKELTEQLISEGDFNEREGRRRLER